MTFPRVLGIECVGIVAASTDPMVPDGTTVAAVMGEMGRQFDGGYAEYALLPNSLLMPVMTTLPWDILAALPETYLTAQGSLDALGVMPGGQGRLLIRGGTSSVGMAAASIASGYSVKTAATTRRPDKIDALIAAGADYALIDAGGPLAASVYETWPEGPDYVLDLVGASTAADSLRLVRRETCHGALTRLRPQSSRHEADRTPAELASVMPEKRAIRAPRATSASMRAKGAPGQ